MIDNFTILSVCFLVLYVVFRAVSSERDGPTILTRSEFGRRSAGDPS